MVKQVQHPKATLETLSLHHCPKSVPAGPGWGLTGPLLNSMNWVNCGLQWNTNKLKRLYISQEKKKNYCFSDKVNFKKYPWQDAIWNANTKPVISQSLNIKNDLNIYSGSLEDVRLIVILKLIGWDLSWDQEWDFQKLSMAEVTCEFCSLNLNRRCSIWTNQDKLMGSMWQKMPTEIFPSPLCPFKAHPNLSQDLLLIQQLVGTSRCKGT